MATSNRQVAVSLPYSRDVDKFSGFDFYIEGVSTSEDQNDVTLKAEFIPASGDAVEAQASLTVVKIGDVVLPGAPDDGLVVMRGTSVLMEVECEPEDASMYLSTLWQTRKLKGDGTYTSWDYAGGNYDGNQILCGIVDFDGEGIAAGRYIVNRDYEDWLDGTSGFRRYKDE